ncbi:TetR/AcrR family transcriptional regulator [Ovoidimarina sediminis]|uniref:TetR/AcrR family transcriptional regulator n=1 Tax=Ovoidimarina sediminis TaxID=3079856 RepID=UPI002914A3C9|nr:helix-turn-helix domain-containing protein [Rhodophyticola sp. MJ-SS7]MDU8945981.1 helix-turn-helix domain-containing protein [Rhodophyticola sp. MJ-SS7]
MSEADKQRSHRRILDAAARLFRENGIEGTSVADVMNAAGMTHGGFYRHFGSKEELVAAAFRHAVDDVVSRIEEEETPEGRAVERDAYIADYLSEAHLKELGKGCPLASLGAELARAGQAPLHEGAEAAIRMAEVLLYSDDDDKTKGLAVMALLMGSITLARLAESPENAHRALEAGKTGAALLQEHWD